jgi:hypothetical protein
MYSKASLSEQE